MGAHVCNPSTWETEVGGLGVQGQPGLHSKNLLEGREGKGREGKRYDGAFKSWGLGH
jgi:hypothetical protein